MPTAALYVRDDDDGDVEEEDDWTEEEEDWQADEDWREAHKDRRAETGDQEDEIDPTAMDSGDAKAIPALALSAQSSAFSGIDKVSLKTPFRSASGGYSIGGLVVASILILTGLVFVFFGHRLFRTVLFIAGFYVVGMGSSSIF